MGEGPDLVDIPQFGGNRHGGGRVCCYSPLQVLHLSPKLQEHSGYKTNALASFTVHLPIFLTLNYEHCCLLCVILLQKNGGKLGRPNTVQELQRLPFGESGTFNIALLLIRILALYSLHIWWDSLKLRG